MTIGAIIQARLDSTRLCHKVFRPIGDKVVLDHVIDAALQAKRLDVVCVTTPDLAIFNYVSLRGELCVRPLNGVLYRGERNPLLEYYQCAKLYEVDLIVRLTADCPMLTGEIIDSVVKKHLDKVQDVKYTYNQTDGVDVEVFGFEALSQAYHKAGPDEREHVTTWIRKYLPCQYLEPLKGEYLSVNTAVELEQVRKLMGKEL